MRPEKEKALFESSSIWSALLRLALPTVMGQIVLVIYNMADTFFVGLRGQDAMLTAVTVSMPAFMLLSAISNLFGIGGASVIARAMGGGQREKVPAASAFAFWGCLASSLLYALLVLLLQDPLLELLGASHPQVKRLAAEYLTVTVVWGGSATALSALFSHLLRAEGRSLPASLGIILGGVLNILLDPLFMFYLLPPGRETLGAALATAISNAFSLLYFVLLRIGLRGRSALSVRPRAAMWSPALRRDILSAGLPACVMTLCENASFAVLDKLMSLEGLPMQAGIGVAKKVNMLAHCSVRGIAQGALPLISYNFAAGQVSRMRRTLHLACRLAVLAAGLWMIISFVFSRQLTGLFIHHSSSSLDFGSTFLRILCLGGPFSAAAYTMISFFQATGEGRQAFLLALLRKGLMDIPLMLLLCHLWPVFGMVAATPITDAVCCSVSFVLYCKYMQGLARRGLSPAM